MQSALVLGAGGFIGAHLVKRLKQKGFTVTGADLKMPEFSETAADEFFIGDLRDPQFCAEVISQPFTEVYQLAADMGGAGYIFTGHQLLNFSLPGTRLYVVVVTEQREYAPDGILLQTP